MSSPDANRLLRIARLLLLLEQTGVDISGLLPLRAFTTFAVQYRYDDEPQDLSLNRSDWCKQAEALIDQVISLVESTVQSDWTEPRP